MDGKDAVRRHAKLSGNHRHTATLYLPNTGKIQKQALKKKKKKNHLGNRTRLSILIFHPEIVIWSLFDFAVKVSLLHFNTHASCFSSGLDVIDSPLRVKEPLKLFIASHHPPKPARQSKI